MPYVNLFNNNFNSCCTPMEEIPLFVLAIIFGGFFLFFIIMCCIRIFVFLTDDKRFLCFKSKASLRRRRIQLSLLPEVNLRHTPNIVGYQAPDENMDENTICQAYVYEDGRSTGMRMLANLPIAIAFRTQSGISADSLFGAYPPYIISPNLNRNLEPRHHYEELPPPNYDEAHFQNRSQNEKLELEEPPPPSYDECMKSLNPAPDIINQV